MNELLEKEQIVSIIPQNFRNANKGKVLQVDENGFLMEVIHPPDGILLDNLCEFYSHTKNGTLYFTSDVVQMQGNILTVLNPIKHRFLQRRKFTRIKFIQNIDLCFEDEKFPVSSLDLSAGGMKLKSSKNIDIDKDYKIEVSLSDELSVGCKFHIIRIEKADDGSYILCGRFTGMSNIDKMTLIQFCMNKNMESSNKEHK